MHDGKRLLSLSAILLAVMAAALDALPARAVSLPFGKHDEAVKYVPSGAWEAYIHDEKGRDRALLQPIEKNDDKDWMFLNFTEYKGPRSRVAVMQVDNRSADADTDAQLGGVWAILLHRPAETVVPLPAIEELITDVLARTNRFKVVERKRVADALAEQDLGQSGRISAATAPKLGNMLGAEYLLIAAVSEWTPNKSGAGVSGGLGGKILSGLGAQAGKAEVAMSFRLVDATSGQVIFSTTERSTAGSWGFNLGNIGPLGKLGYGAKAPINYAVQSCVNKAAYKLAMETKSRAWKGTVVKVDGSRVFINAGSADGMEMGMKLTALSKGESLTDPDTGLTIGEDNRAIGNLTVTTVQDGVSIATVVQGCKDLKKGDRVEMASP